MTGTPDSSALRLLPARSSAISLRMSPNVLLSLLLETTSGSSDSTISASGPSHQPRIRAVLPRLLIVVHLPPANAAGRVISPQHIRSMVAVKVSDADHVVIR